MSHCIITLPKIYGVHGLILTRIHRNIYLSVLLESKSEFPELIFALHSCSNIRKILTSIIYVITLTIGSSRNYLASDDKPLN